MSKHRGISTPRLAWAATTAILGHLALFALVFVVAAVTVPAKRTGWAWGIKLDACAARMFKKPAVRIKARIRFLNAYILSNPKKFA